MRRTTSEQVELIRLVESSDLSVRQTLRQEPIGFAQATMLT